MISKQFFKFLLVGGVSALVNILSRVLYSTFSNFTISIVFAFFTALTTAFLLNKFFVFEKRVHNSWLLEYWYFFLANIFGLIQTIAISYLLVYYLLVYYLFPYSDFNFYPQLTAHIIGVIVPVFTSFIGHKYFSFRSANEKN